MPAGAFQRLSRAEYGHAAMLLHLLENCLTSGNNLLNRGQFKCTKEVCKDEGVHFP